MLAREKVGISLKAARLQSLSVCCASVLLQCIAAIKGTAFQQLACNTYIQRHTCSGYHSHLSLHVLRDTH